ncbi:MAG: hypothetical protein ACYC3I_25680 [Gemmataceae bacterium]
MSERDVTLNLKVKGTENLADPWLAMSRGLKEAAEMEKRFQQIQRGGRAGGAGGAAASAAGGATSASGSSRVDVVLGNWQRLLTYQMAQTNYLRQLAEGRLKADQEERKTAEAKRREADEAKKRGHNTLGGVAGAMGMAASATAGVLHSASNVAAIANNPFLGQQQKVERILGELPGPLGEVSRAIIGFKHNIDGTSLALARLAMIPTLLEQHSRYLGSRTALEHERNHEVDRHNYRAAAILGVNGGGFSGVNAIRLLGDNLVQHAGKRSSWKGELAYQQAATRFPAQVALERAEAEVRAARAHYGAASKTVEQGTRFAGENPTGMHMLPAYRADMDRTKRGIEIAMQHGTTKDVARAIEEAMKAQASAMRNVDQLQADINRKREAGLTLAEKENQLAKAKLGVLEAEKHILGAKEGRQSHGAMALGAMRPGERAVAGIALTMFKQGMPLNMMPTHMRSALERVAPGAMQKEYERLGEKTDTYKRFQDAGLIDAGSLTKTRKELAEIDAKVQVTLALNEADLEKKIAKVLEKAFGSLIKILDEKTRIEVDRIHTGMQQQHTVGGH